MDALGAYGSDDSDSSVEEPQGTLLAAYASDDNSNDDPKQDSLPAPSSTDVTGTKRSRPVEAVIQFPFLPAATKRSNGTDSWKWPFMDLGTSTDGSYLSKLQDQIQDRLTNNSSNSDNSSLPRSNIARDKLAHAGVASYAELLDKTKSHEFRNPLVMEQMIQQLGISDSLSAMTGEQSLDWETNLMVLEEQARVRQFQQQPSQATSFAQDQISHALSQRNQQGDV